jgi:TPR repeat protein
MNKDEAFAMRIMLKWTREAGRKDVKKPKKVLYLMLALLAYSPLAWAGPDTSADAVRKAAQQGDVGAQHSLGLIYFTGQGVPKDLAEAAKWFREAAEKGFAASQYMLGITFLVSEDAPKDYAEAAKWFRLASEQGYTDAQAMLSAAYVSGRGVERDDVMALMWSSIAATHGDKDASELRDEVARSMTPDQIARAQEMARDWTPKPQTTPIP